MLDRVRAKEIQPEQLRKHTTGSSSATSALSGSDDQPVEELLTLLRDKFATGKRNASLSGSPSPSSSRVAFSDDGLPPHVSQAISGLQREIILIRNELFFELWLSRQNIQHIGRLFQDRILSKAAEAERQGLVGRLNRRLHIIHTNFFRSTTSCVIIGLRLYDWRVNS